MDISSLVSLVVWVIIIGSVFGLLWWLVGYAGLPAPFDKFARIALAVIAVLILINLLLGLVGSAPFRLKG
jgi:predicted tellurium resistance membrane protein TerC